MSVFISIIVMYHFPILMNIYVPTQPPKQRKLTTFQRTYDMAGKLISGVRAVSRTIARAKL